MKGARVTSTVQTPASREEAPRRQAPADADPLTLTVIEKRSTWLPDLAELWRYRELLFILAWRDIKVRYKQTALGVAWAVLQPLATMAVFSIFFGRVAEMPSGGVPYPLFVFAGLLPWFFFQSAVTSSSGSVVGNQALVTKVYFPRLIIPLSSAGSAVIDFAVSFALLLAMMPIYGTAPGWGVLLAPLLVVLLGLAALGVGLLLAALTVAYRDFRYVVPFAIQLWMFATPAIYMDPQLIGPTGNAWLSLNPAHGLIAAFRACVLGGDINWLSLGTAVAVTAAFLAGGAAYFRRVERGFADVI